MKKKLLGVLCSFLLGITSGVSSAHADEAPRKIIVFEKTFTNIGQQIALVKSQGAQAIKPLALINAVVGYLPPQAEKALLSRTDIVRIDEDLIVNAIGNS